MTAGSSDTVCNAFVSSQAVLQEQLRELVFLVDMNEKLEQAREQRKLELEEQVRPSGLIDCPLA